MDGVEDHVDEVLVMLGILTFVWGSGFACVLMVKNRPK